MLILYLLNELTTRLKLAVILYCEVYIISEDAGNTAMLILFHATI